MMDLITLLTACSLAFDPKVMHALVWQHSGAEPWSVLVNGEASPQVYANVWQAVDEMRAKPPAWATVRVGLAGLPIDAAQIRTALFLPCRNIATAAEQLAKFVDRCKTHPRLNADPNFCAVAVYRGSWERPDTEFAHAVQASVAKGDPPNFDMSDDTEFNSLDVASELPAQRNAISHEPTIALDEQRQGWSSALFPAKPKQSDSTGTDTQSDDSSSHDPHSRVQSEQHPSTSNPLTSGLFVPKSLPTHD
jgi:hypothetical protein